MPPFYNYPRGTLDEPPGWCLWCECGGDEEAHEEDDDNGISMANVSV